MSENSILLVDDNGNIVDSFRRSTHKEAYNVLTARSGFEALQILKEKHISMVITDEMMPVMKGTELIKRINEEYPEVMAILFTGHLEMTDLAAVFNGGNLFKVFKKPIDLDDLLFHIDKGLRLREAFNTYRKECKRIYNSL